MASYSSVAVARSGNVLTSQANGAAIVYWSPASSYGSFQMCVAVLLSAYAVVLNNAKYRIRGQYSVDGTTWLNLGIGTDGYIDGASAYQTATGAFSGNTRVSSPSLVDCCDSVSRSPASVALRRALPRSTWTLHRWPSHWWRRRG